MTIAHAQPQFKRAELLQVAQMLPSAPRIFSQVSALLGDFTASVDEVTELLKRDAALTTRILRVSNSVTYAGEQAVASLDEAVQRVGFRETYRIVGFATAAQLVGQRLPFYGVTAAAFRENALLTALIMERLAEAVGLDSRSAYTAGLLRSLGKVALDRLCSTRGVHATFAEEGHGPLLEWELAYCGTDNAQAAEVILTEWRFPAETVEAVRDHYTPTASSGPMARLLNIAAAAAERCGHGWNGEWMFWEPAAERLAALGLSDEQLQASTRLALEAFGPVRVAVG